jgi:putative component of membrane protein insertase Oxa1/YidC/SpoIIIJ protein YidD
MRFKFLLTFFFQTLFAMPGYFEPWGKNADLSYNEDPKTPLLSPLGHVAKAIIHFHQNVISPVDGPRSHFKPSSSNYMLEAIKKHGFFKGYIMGCDRLLRENDDPWVYRTALIDGKIWKTDTPD